MFLCSTFIFLVASLLIVSSALASVRVAASCNGPDVQTQINASVDGDIVEIPAGTCTWTANVIVSNKALTLRGVGIGSTVIIDAIDKSQEFPIYSNPITLDTVVGKFVRVTALTIRGSTCIGCAPFINDPFGVGGIRVDGLAKTWRIDHVHFDRLFTVGVHVLGHTYGVIDHNIFDTRVSSAVLVNHNTWNGGFSGDGSWADDSFFGTDKAVYVENNIMTQDPPPAHLDAMIDGQAGGRVVFRYNKVTNASTIFHGTDGTGRDRGFRTFEIYNNAIHDNEGLHPSGIRTRGGTGPIYNNTITGNFGVGLDGIVFRAIYADPIFGICNGSSVWDGNAGPPAGYPCMDQPGRGKSILISGSPPTPVGWVQNIVEPVYVWNNTFNGVAANLIPDPSTASYFVSGRDFFNNTVKPGYTAFTYPHPLTCGC